MARMRLDPWMATAAAAVVLISGCTSSVPYSVSGGDPFNQQARDAALSGTTPAGPVSTLPQTVEPGAPLPSSAEATAQETARVLAETRPGTAAPVATAAVPDNPGISQENDFDVVSSRETIESDAARIAENRAQYTVVEPQALPTRPGSTGPNIVAFALATNHPVGTPLYARAGLNGTSRAERNCADYASPDQAQTDFLARGGPERDRRGLDPDGDGYACAWDPAPFRKAQQG